MRTTSIVVTPGEAPRPLKVDPSMDANIETIISSGLATSFAGALRVSSALLAMEIRRLGGSTVAVLPSLLRESAARR